MKLFLKFGNFIVLALIFLLGVIFLRETGRLDKLFDKSSKDEIIKSQIDYDHDGVDDYTDILNGAREFVEEKPKYKSKYYAGGYPTDGYYVCTDVFWYALKNAGYDFKTLIDEDIKEHKEDYDSDVGDQNIDFRRVRNIKVFLDKYVMSLDTRDISSYNPGDIVIYDNHIAIVSDVKNKNGENYIIHHDGYHSYEDNGLFRKEVLGHYRWEFKDGSK